MGPPRIVEFNQLKAYQQEYGDFNVPRKEQKLFDWLNIQKGHLRGDRMKPERMRMLAAIGFVKTPTTKRQMLASIGFENTPCYYDKNWLVGFNQLKAYQQEHGDFNVPKEEQKLFNWLNKQKGLLRGDRMKPERMRMLAAIGFEWEKTHEKWSKYFDELKALQQKHGHCRLSKKIIGNGLSNWANRQRIKLRKDQMKPDRKRMLVEIGFVDWL